MVIYADVLICLNIFVNFLLIQVVKAVNRGRISLPRQLLASVVGAVCSLYIFAPSAPVPVELAIRLAISCLVVFCFAGRCGWRRFFKNLAVFYGVSFVYAGIMFALWFILRPQSMAINNGVVYFGVSPVILAVSTLISYGIIKLINRYLATSRSEKTYEMRIYSGDRKLVTTALADTGHTLNDVFSDSAVVVVGKAEAEALFSDEMIFAAASGGELPPSLSVRYRLIPFKSVGGGGLLPAFRCDRLEIELKKHTKTVDNPIVAINREELSGGYGAIMDASLAD